MPIIKKYLLIPIAAIILGLFLVIYFEHFFKSELTNFDVIGLVNKNEFEKLDTFFSDLIAAYHDGIKDELVLSNTYEAFINSDPKFTLSLHSWLELYPDSQAAKLALARHYLHLGWLSRGTRWRKNTKDEQIHGMSKMFSVANEYYVDVAEHDPTMILAYNGMISIAMALGNYEMKAEVVNQALAVHPDSYVFNFKRLFAMQPKWGGSIKEIQNIINELEPLFTNNPKLRLVKGFEAYAIANEITRNDWNKKSCALAVSYLDKAIALYPDDYLYIRRAEYYRCMKEYKHSVADYNKALEISPFNYKSYIGRGYSFYYMDEYKKSIDDLSIAISLDELNSKALQYRGMSYFYSQQYDKANDDFNKSLIYGEYKSYTHKMLGYIYHNQVKNYVKAEEEFSKAVEYGDTKPETLFMLVSSQHHQKDCKFVETALNYIELCKNNKRCNVQDISWATNSIMHVQREGTCPRGSE